MKRKPIYYIDAKGQTNHMIRVISLSGGRWLAQSTTGVKGDRRFDPWQSRFRPTSLIIAISQMSLLAARYGA